MATIYINMCLLNYNMHFDFAVYQFQQRVRRNISRSLLKVYLSYWQQQYPQTLLLAWGSNGKPYFTNARLGFSYSHCKNKLLIAYGHHIHIGVDLIHRQKKHHGCYGQIDLAKPAGLMRFCIYEAYGKLTGQGFNAFVHLDQWALTDEYLEGKVLNKRRHTFFWNNAYITTSVNHDYFACIAYAPMGNTNMAYS